MSRDFIAKMAERAGKTFLQFFFANWILLSGAAADFDHLFTWDNAQAGVVGLALSIMTSIASKPVSPPDDPSLV